jgi:hypothetical protein
MSDGMFFLVGVLSPNFIISSRSHSKNLHRIPLSNFKPITTSPKTSIRVFQKLAYKLLDEFTLATKGVWSSVGVSPTDILVDI